MTRGDLIQRVRAYTRDFSNSIFRELDIINFINESIDRIREIVPELSDMNYLTDNKHVPKYLPEQYHVLLAIYSASRCFGQDEQHYQSTTFMNEFETKLDELKNRIEAGDIIITNDSGVVISTLTPTDYVRDVYFN